MNIDRVVCGVALFLLVVIGVGFVAGGYHRVEVVESNFTPRYGAHASLTVTPTEVTNETSIKLTISNIGTVGLQFGLGYDIEKLVDGSWMPVPACYFVPSVGIGQRSGGKYSHKMDVVGLDSGRYRATKDIDAERTSLEEKPYAYFTVDRPPEEDTGELPSYGFSYQYVIIPYTKNSPDGPKFILLNFGARSLYFDSSYTLEKKTGEWHEIYAEEAEPDLTIVKWGEEYTLKIGEPPFESGRYRLTIVFGIEGTSAKEKLVEDFSN